MGFGIGGVAIFVSVHGLLFLSLCHAHPILHLQLVRLSHDGLVRPLFVDHVINICAVHHRHLLVLGAPACHWINLLLDVGYQLLFALLPLLRLGPLFLGLRSRRVFFTALTGAGVRANRNLALLLVPRALAFLH